VSVPALPELSLSNLNTTEHQRLKEERNVFVELMPLLKERTLLITVARVDATLKVNIIPTKVKEGEDGALTTPLSYAGSAEDLDVELGKHLASYVASHLQLGNNLAEAKAEMEAAARAARQKSKATPSVPKPDPAGKKEETAAPVLTATETTPSLFAAQPQVPETPPQAVGEEGRNSTP
jgi:PRTRC genetic system protein E